MVLCQGRQMIHKTIGLVGVGNMGTSILEGVLRQRLARPSQLWVHDVMEVKAKSFARKTGVKNASSVHDLFRNAEIILLAMKPQDFPAFASGSRCSLRKEHGFISILAGLSTGVIQRALGPRVPVVRSMPNLGAKVGESMTALCGRDRQLLAEAAKLFEGCGKVVCLPERHFDLVTAVSGSGPAYFFYLMELLEDFGVKQGLSRKVASALAVQTGVGAALLAKAADVPCRELRERVTSKKGTTEAALTQLMRKNFGTIFQQGLAAAMDRSRELRERKTS